MIIATEDDLTTLQERRRQLSDRLEELRSELPDIQADVAACETDWLDAITVGEDSTLLSERLELRRRELSSNRKAGEHVSSLLADLDRQIAHITATAQLADDAASYRVALATYGETLPDLPTALPTAVEVVAAALDDLLGEVDTARSGHDQLLATAGSLRQRAEMLGVEVDLSQPEAWNAQLERAYKGDDLRWPLVLGLLQRRGKQAILREIERIILIAESDQRRALR